MVDQMVEATPVRAASRKRRRRTIPPGYSVGNTARKQHDLAYILATHISITQRVWARAAANKKHWLFLLYVFLDLNAGTGHGENGELGSPLIALDLLVKCNIPFWVVLFEYDPARAAQLHRAIVERYGWRGGQWLTGRDPQHRVQIIVGDHDETVHAVIADIERRVDRKVLGLAYADGNGQLDDGLVPLNALARVKQLEYFDLLLHANATVYKKTRGARQHDRHLLDEVRAIPKKYRLIREPNDIWQWTMFLLTKWTDMPKFATLGFHDLTSDQGQELALRLDLKNGEWQPAVAEIRQARVEQVASPLTIQQLTLPIDF